MRLAAVTRRRYSIRAAFTLVEVIIAAGISVILIFAVYRAIAMHYLHTQAGRAIAERAQLVRGLFRQIRSDVRATFLGYKPAGQRTSDGSGAQSTTAAGVQDPYDVPVGGVLGDASSMTLVVRMPPASFDFSPNSVLGSSAAAVSDLQMVRYRVADDETASDGTSRVGLVREQIFRLPDPTISIDPLDWARTDVLAEEVRSLEIAYYDGLDWYATWDTEISEAPQAIEITLGIAGAHDGGDPATRNDQVTYYRLLVALGDSGSLATSDSTNAASPNGTSTGSGGATQQGGSSNSGGSP
jgi:hypothetical protein